MPLARETFQHLCKARDLLGEIREDSLSIPQVAREARISPFHFIRQFEALFGVTPHQFRIQSRIDCAKRLLAGGELSVTEVCMEVGWSSLGSFSDSFVRRTGETPSDYRRRARVLVQVPEIYYPGCLSLLGRLPATAFRNFGEANGARVP